MDDEQRTITISEVLGSCYGHNGNTLSINAVVDGVPTWLDLGPGIVKELLWILELRTSK